MFISQPMVSVFVAVIPAKAGIQCLSGFRVAFHLPGMTILLPKMSTPYSIRGPGHSPGVYLRDNSEREVFTYFLTGMIHGSNGS
jgi:hypothetical protein